MKTGNIHVLDGDGGVRIEGALSAGGEFAPVSGGGIETRIGAVDRVRSADQRSRERAAAGEREGANSLGADGVLFEAVDAVFLDGVVQECERVTVVEEANTGTQHPTTAAVRLPRD